MIQYERYFDEWNVPPSGIDTISIWIHPSIIKRWEDFHTKGNIREAVNLRKKHEINYRDGQLIRTNYYMDIQAEAINPSFNISEQVVQMLAKLVYDGTLKNDHTSSKVNIPGFFRTSFSRLFALDQLDFYFDLELAYMHLVGLPNPKYPNTRYSSDRPYSSLKTYDKRNRFIQKNHLPHERINAIKYPQRIEFSFKRANCDYLEFQNLQGSYQEVFCRFLPFLAKKWRKYSPEILHIPDGNLPPYAVHLWHIIVESSQRHIPQYSELERTPRKPVPFKKAGKKDVDLNYNAEYLAGLT